MYEIKKKQNINLNDPYANQRLNAKETKSNEVKDLLRKQKKYKLIQQYLLAGEILTQVEKNLPRL
jgi:hypothetical protein